jgi:hypothetical protein
VKYLAENVDKAVVKRIYEKLKISLLAHKSTFVGVVAHHDCAANPVPKKTQIKQLHLAVKHVGKMCKDLNVDARVVGLWVGKDFETAEKCVDEL